MDMYLPVTGLHWVCSGGRGWMSVRDTLPGWNWMSSDAGGLIVIFCLQMLNNGFIMARMQYRLIFGQSGLMLYRRFYLIHRILSRSESRRNHEKSKHQTNDAFRIVSCH